MNNPATHEAPSLLAIGKPVIHHNIGVKVGDVVEYYLCNGERRMIAIDDMGTCQWDGDWFSIIDDDGSEGQLSVAEMKKILQSGRIFKS